MGVALDDPGPAALIPSPVGGNISCARRVCTPVRTSLQVEAVVPDGSLESFERVLVPLLDDAYTLARHVLREEHDAQDVVQEAYLRAWRHWDGFRGGDARPWLLTIVRNCCYTWRRTARPMRDTVEYVDEEHGGLPDSEHATDARAMADADRATLHTALAQLPPEHREAIVLREIQGLSYKEIAHVTGSPIGTIMSRLARARRKLQDILGAPSARDLA
jgi:RNA polymerase sigma-70 factor (ECF subfamily)